MLLAASLPEVSLRFLVAVLLAFVTTAISLRLLGARRGWGRALVSGLAGWSVGALLALGLNGWNWGADGLLTHMVAIAVPATMAIAVALDLLARPGSLAVAEQAGLVTAPRPLRAIRARMDVLRRYREAPRAHTGTGIRALPRGRRKGGTGGRARWRPPPPRARGCRRRVRQDGPDRRDAR